MCSDYLVKSNLDHGVGLAHLLMRLCVFQIGAFVRWSAIQKMVAKVLCLAGFASKFSWGLTVCQCWCFVFLAYDTLQAMICYFGPRMFFLLG